MGSGNIPVKPEGDERIPSVSLSVLGSEGDEQQELASGTVRRPRGARRGDLIGGRYLVEGTLGRGGMGRVMAVRHKVLGKSFALKLIKNRIAGDERIRDLFYREGRLMSGLSHENICSIVDFGDDPVFGLFMVMELLEGTSLKAKLLYDGGFVAKAACDVVRQVAEALHYIHRRDIVHGDIKSENILLTRKTDRRRVVKLLDFGLARAAEGAAADRVAGTPEYLAPERIRGEAATARSDIYALGILFYEILVGRPPFTGSMEEVLKGHSELDIPVPSQQVGGRIDERADEIILKATAKNPQDRHEDMAALVYELRTLLDMLGHGRSTVISAVHRTDAHAAAEVFELAPLPLASINSAGVIVVANRAFLEFLGEAELKSSLQLTNTGLSAVYPGLERDLAAALTGKTVKRIIRLSEGGDSEVEVAVLFTAPATGTGEVHIALHPLARRHRSSKS